MLSTVGNKTLNKERDIKFDTGTKKIRSDARRNKNIIMSSTIELSHSNIDITEMKMSDIAKHAGVGGGTLYRLLRARHVYANQLWTSRLKLCFKKLIRI